MGYKPGVLMSNVKPKIAIVHIILTREMEQTASKYYIWWQGRNRIGRCYFEEYEEISHKRRWENLTETNRSAD